MGRFQEAFDLYSKALTIDPNNVSICAKLYYNRGVVAAKVDLQNRIVRFFFSKFIVCLINV